MGSEGTRGMMAGGRRGVGAICVAERFPELRKRLIELLRGLSAEDWEKRTAAPLWTVKDVAAHLLGGDVGNVSRRRDAYRPGGKEFHSYEELVAFINGLNATWVTAAKRLSPRVLCDLLEFTEPMLEEYFASVDLMAMGEPVDWAGPGPAPVWLDVAREFTERWHHQQQIRDATGRPPLYEPYFFAPVLDAFMRALPHSFRDVQAAKGTVVKIEISGEAGGVWFLERDRDGWELLAETDAKDLTEVVIPQDAAWRMFTKGLNAGRARAVSKITGDAGLAGQVFSTTAILG
jgi:uncharacterized protein (TIGR03083 family)